jgi:glycine cleavage system T protein (aminomethyltransferase)
LATDNLKRTPLHALHASLGAKLVPFGGYEMPVQYRDGIAAEHRAVREAVGVFDISHMGEFEVTGPDRNAFVQRVTCNDVGALKPGQAQYSALLTEQGTFVDDCVVYRFADKLMLVVNAANIAADWEQVVNQKRGANIRLRDISDEAGLLAVQGPGAEALLAPLTPAGIGLIPYYHFVEGKVAGKECFISRTGYTGEDGFEIYIPPAEGERIWKAIFEAGKDEGILPCGLGARNTLRLEAAMSLYGHEINESITPYEANLGWIIKLDRGDFIGRDALLKQKKEGVAQRVVGFEIRGRGIGRDGYRVHVEGRDAGWVTSGSPSPLLQKNIGLCMLPVAQAVEGRPIEIEVRQRLVEAETVPTPFYRRKKQD